MKSSAVTMPSDAQHAVPPPLRPSVFLSYASADRAAARELRDTLEATGLDVWIDEEELGGGEAWDTKIRNQIRTCTYFMPVISATTENRREGYFRREWRLAVERTLDLADDVMFLVPIVIDGTRDVGARVPEKFFSVQWLRVPGGQATPQLRELARKLATNEAVAHPPIPAATPVPDSGRKARGSPKVLPPFPQIPPFPEPGNRLRFCYELVPWSGRMLQALWIRMPKVVRAAAAVMIALNVTNWFFRSDDHPTTSKSDDSVAAREITKAAIAAAKHISDSQGKVASPDFIQSLVSASTEALQAGRPLAIVNFSSNDKDARIYADRLFGDLVSLLQKNAEDKISISAVPLPADSTADDALGRGTKLESNFVLSGFAQHTAENQEQTFTVKLYNVKQRALVWTETYNLAHVDAATTAQRLADAVKQRAFPAPEP